MKYLLASSLLVIVTAYGAAADTDTAPVAPAGSDAPATKQPDNSAVNKRDRADKTLTPEDQAKNDASADSSDVTVLAAIRRAITKDDTISTNGHNVKIIVKGGVATLRGPVKDEAEKTSIAQIATKTDGVTKVDNQLEVATK